MALDDTAAATSVAGEMRIERAAGVVEWFRRAPGGLEQGVSLSARIPGEGPLSLEIVVEGARVAQDGVDVVFEDARTGERVGSYRHLVVVDADGQTLPAAMLALGEVIRIDVDDATARYPIVIDPLIGDIDELVVRDPPGISEAFGHSVSFDRAGALLVVGIPRAPGSGSAALLERGPSWAPVATLSPPSDTSERRGQAVALSADGTRAVVGADTPFNSTGSAHVYRRESGTWLYEATLIPPPDERGDAGSPDQFGLAVDIDDAGATVIVGAPFDDYMVGRTDYTDAGSARIYARTGTSWAQTAFLTLDGSSAVADDGRLGTAVALSGDGTRAAVGAPNAAAIPLTPGARQGVVSVFAATAGSWALEAQIGRPLSRSGDRQGASVALDGDGTTLVVGSPGFDLLPATDDAGSAYVFERAGTEWMASAPLAPPSLAAGDALGTAVAISDDGLRVLVGAPLRDVGGATHAGVAFTFSREGTGWIAGEALGASAPLASDELGTSVALSGDGAYAALGAPRDDVGTAADAGSVTVFVLRATDPLGTRCADGRTCDSGLCSDGVCCGTACDGPCDACTVAAGSVADGACSFLPSTATCRGSAGDCDIVEHCTGSQASCPADIRENSGHVCRASVRPCDVAEVCNGVDPTCPGDGVAAPGTVCGVGEDCSLPGTCDGSGMECVSSGVREAGYVCRSVEGACDVEDLCDGITQLCEPRFATADVACGTLPTAPCDTADHCAGDSASCVPTFLVGTVCRPSMGSCDPPELCGADAECPADQLVPSSIVCRESIDSSCDPAESCDGVAATCPADRSTCAVPDGGAAPDAARADASGSDAGVAAPAAGCACAAGARWGWLSPGAALLSAFALFRRRRAQRQAP